MSNLNDIFDLTLNRLNIPIDSKKATPLQVAQIRIIQDFNNVIFEYIMLANIEGGNEQVVMDTLRSYIDMIQLMFSEVKNIKNN